MRTVQKNWWSIFLFLLACVESPLTAQPVRDSNTVDASTRVLRVDIVRTDGKPAFGTAVILHGEANGIIAATCYHCIEEAKQLSLDSTAKSEECSRL